MNVSLLRPSLHAQATQNDRPTAVADTRHLAVPSARVSAGPMRAITSGAFAFMGRRIPPMHPEMSAEKAQALCAQTKPGDVILTADLAYPGWARMEFWTIRSNYTHAALVGSDGHVYESVDGGVQKVPLASFFEGRIKVATVRLGLDAGEAARATEYCQRQLGKPYDEGFDTLSDDAFYCSELVAKALGAGRPGFAVPHETVLGRTAVAPDAFLAVPGAQRVHDDGSSYWTNKVTYWPLALSAAAAGSAGAAAGGVAGAVVGGTLGLLASILVGNKIQTGHCLPSVQELRESKR